MNQPQKNPQPNGEKTKWIALSILFLFILSGGIYQVSQRKSANSTDGVATGTASNSLPAQPGSMTVAGGPPTSPSSQSPSTEHGSASTPSSTSLAVTGAVPGSISGSATGTTTGKSVASGSGTVGVSGAAIPTGGVAAPAAPAAKAGGFLSAITGIFSGSGSASKEANKDSKQAAMPAGTVQGTGVVAAPGMPGAPTTIADGTAPTQATLAPVAPPVVDPDQCVTVTYKHKALSAHPDEESCSHHKNMLKLPKLADFLPNTKDPKINSGSVCVRVNGTPVHYLTVKNRPDELIFGALAGPKSKVTVRFCTGKSVGCPSEDCVVPKDEFMEAIGGTDGGSQNAKLGQWDPTAPADKEADVMAKLDNEVKRELETNNELNGRAPAGELFKDWIGENQAAACGTAQAKN